MFQPTVALVTTYSVMKRAVAVAAMTSATVTGGIDRFSFDCETAA